MARFSEAEKTLIWDWWQQGGSMRGVARELGRAHASVRTADLQESLGCPPGAIRRIHGVSLRRAGVHKPNEMAPRDLY